MKVEDWNDLVIYKREPTITISKLGGISLSKTFRSVFGITSEKFMEASYSKKKNCMVLEFIASENRSEFGFKISAIIPFKPFFQKFDIELDGICGVKTPEVANMNGREIFIIDLNPVNPK
jgi:hypothetical protein